MEYQEKLAFLRRYRDAQRTMRQCMEEADHDKLCNGKED